MSREIKLRGYSGNGFSEFSVFGMNPPLKKDSFMAVCEWTGLYDKNGYEIYEGDLVSMFGGVKEVVFVDGAFGYYPSADKEITPFVSFQHNYNFDWKDGRSEKIEVVGNIYGETMYMK